MSMPLVLSQWPGPSLPECFTLITGLRPLPVGPKLVQTSLSQMCLLPVSAGTGDYRELLSSPLSLLKVQP